MTTSTSQPDRSRPPHAQRALLPEIETPETFIMSSGLRVFLLHDREAEGIRLEFILPAGTSWHENPLTAAFTIALLREGTIKYQGHKLIAKLDGLGAFVELQASADYAWLTAYVHKSKTAHLIPYLVSMLTEPQFGSRQFNLYRQRQLARFRTEMLRTRTLAQRAFKANIYGSDSSYGRLADETSYKNLRPADLTTFFKSTYTSNRIILIAAGNIRYDWLNTLDQGLRGINTLKAEGVRNPVRETKATGLICVPKEDALQSSIMMGRLVVDRLHPDFPALTLLNTIFGGYFGARLMSNLREDKGYTYGIYSQITPQEMATKLTISAEVGADVIQNALNEIRHEIRRLQEEKVPARELNLVKNYLAGSYAQALDGVYSKALRLRNLAPLGMNLEYYNRLLQQIHETDADKIRTMARKYLSTNDMLTVVAGRNQTLS
ncbi:MAG: insulinase family protein [Bacteroidia bacterium]|nr:insulinase family protein [Bacteroidia bacterium]